MPSSAVGFVWSGGIDKLGVINVRDKARFSHAFVHFEPNPEPSRWDIFLVAAFDFR